jgi:hypothetical protein
MTAQTFRAEVLCSTALAGFLVRALLRRVAADRLTVSSDPPPIFFNGFFQHIGGLGWFPQRGAGK